MPTYTDPQTGQAVTIPSWSLSRLPTHDELMNGGHAISSSPVPGVILTNVPGSGSPPVPPPVIGPPQGSGSGAGNTPLFKLGIIGAILYFIFRK